MTRFIGIDFGTTNSAVGLVEPGQPPRLARFRGVGDRPGDSPTWRTVLYFDPHVDQPEDVVSAGADAIARYRDNDGEGRLILSIKSYLASRLFKKTRILGKTWSLEQLIGTFLRLLRASVDVDLGRCAVVGRPVRYWGADTAEDDERAVERMRAALSNAGFDQVAFEYEPIAASLRYSHGLQRDERVLIADFGGGTSDFSVIRVGPTIDAGSPEAILATGGIGIGGDTFDGHIVDRALAPMLGKGSRFRDEFGAEMPVPPWIYSHLRRWHQLSFLRSPKTQYLLERIGKGALEPRQIRDLVHIIENDLGLALHHSIEGAKVALSDALQADLAFADPPVELHANVTRDRFNGWLAGNLDTLDAVIDQVLADAGLASDAIDRVFTTGGSSFVPALRQRLGQRFGAERVTGGDELTSVAWGLAVRARQLFG